MEEKRCKSSGCVRSVEVFHDDQVEKGIYSLVTPKSPFYESGSSSQTVGNFFYPVTGHSDYCLICNAKKRIGYKYA